MPAKDSPNSSFALESAIDRDPITVVPETPLVEAIALMSGHGSSCLLPRLQPPLPESLLAAEARGSCVLVLAGTQLAGLLTERDVVRLAAGETNLDGVTVGEVMSREVIALKESEIRDIFTVLDLFRGHRIRHLPLLKEDGSLAGIVTTDRLRKSLQPSDLLRLRTAGEVMTEEVIHAPPTTSIRELAQLMAQHRVSCIVIAEEKFDRTQLTEPALDSSGENLSPVSQNTLVIPVGIVTERDIVQFQALELDFESISAEKVMSAPLFSLSPKDSLLFARQEMERRRVRRLIVCGDPVGAIRESPLLGIVTQTSLLRVLDPLEMYEVIKKLQQDVCRLEAKKIERLQEQRLELEKEVRERTAKIQKQASREKILSRISQRIRQSLNLEDILKTTVTEVRKLLGCDRAIVYQFQPDWSGIVVAESVTSGWDAYLGKVIYDPCFAPNWVEPYTNGRIRTVDDIYASDMAPCHLELLEQLQIRSKLVVPIIQSTSEAEASGSHPSSKIKNRLWGLLSAHQCGTPRQWHSEEIDLLKELATQLAIAIQQSTLFEQVQVQLKERQLAEAKLRIRDRQQEAVALLGRRALAQTDLDALMEEAVALVSGTLNVEYAGVFELLPNQAALWLRAGFGWGNGLARHAKVSTGRKSQAGYTLLASEPVFVSDLAIETRFSGSPLLHDRGVKSGMSVIIPGKDLPFGVLSAHSSQTRTFSEDDVNFLQAIANTIATAADRFYTEEELNRFFHVSLDLFCIAGVDGYFKRINPRFEAVLGYSEPELLSRSFFDFIHPEDVEATQFKKERLSLGYSVYNFENRYRCKEGNYRWFAWTAIPYGDNLIYAVARDITESKQTEADLRESEAKFRQLAEHIREVFFIEDVESGEVIYISPAFESMWGLPCEAIYKNPLIWMEAIHPDDRSRAAAALPRQRRGECFDLEYRIIRPNGEIRWILTRAFPVRDSQGQIYRVVGSVEDITARKEVEEALKNLNQELETIVEQRTAQIKQTNEQLRVEIIERQQIEAEMETRARQQAIIAELGQMALSGAYLETLINLVSVQVARGLQVEYGKVLEIPINEAHLLTLAISSKSSSGFTLLDREPISAAEMPQNLISLERLLSRNTGLSGLSIAIEGKNACFGILGAYSSKKRDFTQDDIHFVRSAANVLATAIERQKIESDLRASEERFRATFEQAAVGIALGGLDGRLLKINQRFCDMVGYSQAELLTKTFMEITYPLDLESDLQYVRQVMADEIKTFSMEKRYICKDGQILWGNLTVSLARKPSGEPDYFIGVVEDISDRKQAEKRLQASLQEKEVLLKEIHHRVKNNLQVISSMLDLQSQHLEDPQMLDMFDNSQYRIQSMALIHEQLYQSHDLAEIDFADYVENLVANLFLSFGLEGQGVKPIIKIEKLSLNLDTAIPCGLIINELVSNALKHGFSEGGPGEVCVEIYLQSDEQFILIVRDTGIGFPADLDFQNVESSLGLQLVCTLTEQLRGTIELDRSQGTKFKLTLAQIKHRHKHRHKHLHKR